jgi:hypothetical protein
MLPAAAAIGVASLARSVRRVGMTYARYGRIRPHADPAARDDALDRLMPRYDVVERHHVRIAAPAGVVLDEARRMDINSAPVVRAVFRGRELIMRSAIVDQPPPQGLVADMQAIGWGPLAEIPIERS